MKGSRKTRMGLEEVVVLCAAISLIASAVVVSALVVRGSARIGVRDWLKPVHEARPEIVDMQTRRPASDALDAPLIAQEEMQGLFSSELRVVAIGSAYPIAFEAEVCPFSGIPQPALNQLDRDGDGITDDWEMKYGLDRHAAADALDDPDGDGFTNLEEFNHSSDPQQAASHPPYAIKLRFVKRIEVPFPLIFQSVNILPGGDSVFQLNSIPDGMTYFRALGEEIKDIELQSFIPRTKSDPARLVVRRGEAEIELPQGEKLVDPESEAELINILDRSFEIATMGALLSLNDDTYTVVGVYQDKVLIRHNDTGNEYEIVGLAEGEH